MMVLGPQHSSPKLAIVASAMLAALVASIYYLSLTESHGKVEEAKAAFGRIAWVSAAADEWRGQYESQLSLLKTDLPFAAGVTSQDAALVLQSSLRQTLIGAGASIDSMQVTVAEVQDNRLPAISAIATLTLPADRLLSALRAIESMRPLVAIESIDIAGPGATAANDGQPLTRVTIRARSYASVPANEPS